MLRPLIHAVRTDGTNALLAILVCVSIWLPEFVGMVVWGGWSSNVQYQGQRGLSLLLFLAMVGMIFVGLLAGYGTWTLWQKNDRVRSIFKDNGASA